MLSSFRSRLSSDNGFSLIELLVVVMIMAILIAAASPAFLGQQEKARNASTQNEQVKAISAQAISEIATVCTPEKTDAFKLEVKFIASTVFARPRNYSSSTSLSVDEKILLLKSKVEQAVLTQKQACGPR